MKDPTLALRTAYYSFLTSTLPTVKVYDSIIANDAPEKRIALNAQTYNEEGDKDNFGGIATIDIDIISIHALGGGGGKWSDETATTILNALSPTKGTCTLSVTGWNVVTTSAQILPFLPQTQDTSGRYLHRKVLRIKHLVYQL